MAKVAHHKKTSVLELVYRGQTGLRRDTDDGFLVATYNSCDLCGEYDKHYTLLTADGRDITEIPSVPRTALDAFRDAFAICGNCPKTKTPAQLERDVQKLQKLNVLIEAKVQYETLSESARDCIRDESIEFLFGKDAAKMQWFKEHKIPEYLSYVDDCTRTCFCGQSTRKPAPSRSDQFSTKIDLWERKFDYEKNDDLELSVVRRLEFWHEITDDESKEGWRLPVPTKDGMLVVDLIRKTAAYRGKLDQLESVGKKICDDCWIMPTH